MSSETKILFENIKTFRHLLTEGVGESAIADAINNHEWLYIYYDAKNEEGKNATGSRTIRPYVLGTKGPKTMLRAWQDNPRNSWHFDNKPTRDDSLKHDYWSDHEGSKPGWRLFDVDKITRVYPIGKKFNDSRGGPMIPPGYHEGGDDDMDTILAYVSTKDEPDFDYKYDKDREIDVIKKTDRDAERWESIRRGNKNSKQITADDIVKLRDVASRIHKTAHGKYLVVIDDKGNFQLMLAKDKDKQNIPDQAIVGSLPYLYDTLVNPNKQQDSRFFDSQLSQTQSSLNQGQSGVNETEKPTIPHKKMTFFK